MGIAGMQTIKKTTRGLFEECQKLSSNNSDVAVATPSKDNSFHMFLRLTCYQLNEISNSENTSAWRNFKGRLLSKFHQRGMQELTESGLTHFTQLFLTLALCTHDEQLLVSLCDFYNMVDFHVADTRRRCTIWKGIFAAMFISIQWKSDLSILAERLTPLFGFVCNKFGSPTMEPQKRHQLWEILTIYIDGLQEIVDSSPELTLSEYKLVTKDFAMVLHVGRNFEMCSIFGLFNVVLSKLLSLVRTQRENEGDIFIPNDHHEQMAQSLWVNIFPFVESHAKTQTALLEVADLAAQFLILSLTLPDWSPCFSSVFGKFVCDSSVNTQVTCRFLGHVLAEHAVTESLEASESKSPLKDSLQIKLIHSWLRCCLLLGPVSSTQLQAVTSHILRLPAVVRICNLVDNDLVSAGSDNTVVELFKVFGKAHDNAADWESKMKLKEEVKLFVGEICLCIQPLLKSPQSADLLRHVYTVVGHLVKYCAPLLFNDPRLQETIDSLIFPHSLFVPSKPLNPFIQTALYDTLHLFVSGLHKVNSRYAPYVQRRLRDVILQYLPRFPLKRGTTSGEPTSLMSPQLKPHPLVRILTDFLISNSIHNIGSFRQFVLVTTRENLLKVEGLKLSESASLGLSFIVEIVEKTERTEDLARDMAPLLSSLLECYLLAKNPQLKQSTTQILTLLLRASCQHPDMAPKKDLLEILGTFLRSYFPLFSNSLFHLWEKLLPLYPELLADNVPQLTAALKELELKRGSGTDNNLRLQWVAYLTKMGKTQEEIKALL